jgi:hypothetical protein
METPNGAATPGAAQTRKTWQVTETWNPEAAPGAIPSRTMREVRTVRPRNGLLEVWDTALSPEVFREWEEQRSYQSGEQACPDRPPTEADESLAYQRWDLITENPSEAIVAEATCQVNPVTTYRAIWRATWCGNPYSARVALTFGQSGESWFVYRVVSVPKGIVIHDILRLADGIVRRGDIERAFRRMHRKFGGSRGKARVTIEEIEAALPCRQPEAASGLL